MGGCGCDCVGEEALIAASKFVHMCVGEGGMCVCVGGCDCVVVGVIAWVRKGVCGCDGLDCCLKVCV